MRKFDLSAWGDAKIKQAEDVDWRKLEVWAKENLVCVICGRRVPMGDRAKLYMAPDPETKEVEVRIAHFTCFGYEEDGQTKINPNRTVIGV